MVFKRLKDISNVPATAGVIYANPSGKHSYIKCITLCNGGSTTETVKLYRVSDNAGAVGTASDTANITHKLSLLAGQTVMIEVPGQGWVLEDTNDSIQAVTTTANTVTIAIDGAEEVL